jgi:hypothetical protein
MTAPPDPATGEAHAGERRARLAVLRNPAFRPFITAQLVSGLGDAVALVAVPFAVLSIEDSPTAVGVVLACRAVPQVALTLAGGVLADRLPAPRLMAAADLVRAAVNVAVALLVLSGQAEVWHLCALFAMFGAASAVHPISARVLLPATVAPGQIQPANALISMVFSGSAIVGLPAAGALLLVVDPAGALLLDALTFVASASLLGRIRVATRAPSGRRAFWTDFVEGWSQVRARGWLLGGLVHAAAFQCLVLGVLPVVGPALSVSDYQGAQTWSVLLTAIGVGNLAGGLTALVRHAHRPLFIGYGVLLVTTAPALVALGARAAVPVLLAAMFGYGLGLALFNTLWHSAIQEFVPAEVVGRVSAFDSFVSYALRPVGLAVAGPLTVALGARALLFTSAAIIFGLTVLLVSLPSVRRLTSTANG